MDVINVNISTSLPLVSLNILAYNELEYIKYLIPHLIERVNYPNYEIIIIDNGSTDSLDRWFLNNSNQYPKTRFIRIPKNVGYGRGMNIGIKHAQGKYIALINSDALISENWISTAIKLAESDKNIGIIGSPQFSIDEPEENIRKLNQIFYHNVSIVSGGIFLARREYLEKYHFDPNYHLYNEDVDLFNQFLIHKLKIIKISTIYCHHGRYLKGKKKIDTEYSIKRKAQIFTESRLYYKLKWGNFFEIMNEVFVILIQMILSFTKNKKISKGIGIVNGFFSTFKNFPKYFAKRKSIRDEVCNFNTTMTHIRALYKKIENPNYLLYEQYKRLRISRP